MSLQREVAQLCLEFPQYPINRPVCWGSTDGVASANASSAEMFHDVSEQRHLNVLRIFNLNVLINFFILQMNGLIGENRERNLAFVANE